MSRSRILKALPYVAGALGVAVLFTNAFQLGRAEGLRDGAAGNFVCVVQPAARSAQ